MKATRWLFTLIKRSGSTRRFLGGEQVCLFQTRPVLHIGYSHQSLQDAIDDLQAVLHTQGFLARQSGEFDPETKKAVEAFQQQNSLYPDGIVGAFTWAALYYPRLSRSTSDIPDLQSQVKVLQDILNRERFVVKVDGCFGRKTEHALKRFQKAYGLQPDGICGPMTWSVLLGQKPEAEHGFPIGFLLLSRRSLFLLEQILMIVSVYLGIKLSPLGPGPSLPESLATAYGLTCVVPPLVERLQLKPLNSPLLQFAPFLLTGFFWQSVLDFLKKLI